MLFFPAFFINCTIAIEVLVQLIPIGDYDYLVVVNKSDNRYILIFCIK